MPRPTNEAKGKAIAVYRLRLAAEQGHRCCYCGLDFDYSVPAAHPDAVTIEHLIPVGAGGARTWWNEVAACLTCNGTRGSTELSPHEFYDKVQREGRPKPLGKPRYRPDWDAGNAPRERAPMLSLSPPPPLTAKLAEYLERAFGPKRAQALIAERRVLIERSFVVVEFPDRQVFVDRVALETRLQRGEAG